MEWRKLRRGSRGNKRMGSGRVKINEERESRRSEGGEV